MTFIQTSGHSWSTRPFLSAWCRTFMHTREKHVFFLNDLKISLSPAPREGPFHVMFVKTSMDSESQDATNLTSALTDSRIYSFMNMMTLYMCIVAKNHFSQYPTFLFFQCCDNVDIKSHWFLQNQSVDEKFCWTRWTHLELLLTFHTSHLSVAQVTFFFVETDWMSVREPIEDDEARLARKIGDMPPLLPGRDSNPRIRDDQALKELFSNSDKMHCATSDDAWTQAWFDYSRSCIFTQSVRNIGKDVELCNVPTYQCSTLFNDLGSFNRKSEFQKPENLNKPIYQGWAIQYRLIVATSGMLGQQLCSCYLDGRGGQFANRHKAVAWGLWLGGMPINKKQWFVSTCKNWFHRSCSSSLGINRRREWVFPCSDAWDETW